MILFYTTSPLWVKNLSLASGRHANLPKNFFFFLVKPSSYSRTTYTDGRGEDGENTKAEARGLRAQPRAACVQHARAQAET